MFKTFVHDSLYNLLVRLGASENEAINAATFCLDTDCINNIEATINHRNAPASEKVEPESPNRFATDQEKIDFLVSEVQELRELLAPVAYLFKDGSKLDEWSNNIIGAIEMLESATGLINAINVRMLEASSEKIERGFDSDDRSS